MKHNKKRNTAFIYETLSRELTKSIISNNTQGKAQVMAIIKEFFSAGSVLAEELRLYKLLLETGNVQQNLAERLLQEAKRGYAQLDASSIFDAQSKIIDTINKGLGSDVWSNFVPNFKSLASINAIFNTKVSVKKKVLFEQAVVDRMSTPSSQNGGEKLQPVDNLTYRSFIQKFNEKYGALLQEQKDLLNRFITGFADDGLELRVYLNEELARLKRLVKEATEKTDEALISAKLDEVGTYLEEFRKREFTDNDLNKILITQELVKELLVDD